MTALALDTSVAIALLVRTHGDHAAVARWCDGRTVSLSGHAAAGTCSVLTRLPGDVRLAPHDAARLLETRFAAPLVLRLATSRTLASRLGDLGIVGGAVYDALVALAAVAHDAILATRDARARSTYEVVTPGSSWRADRRGGLRQGSRRGTD